MISELLIPLMEYDIKGCFSDPSPICDMIGKVVPGGKFSKTCLRFNSISNLF